MADHSPDWRRLGQHVQRRREQLGLTQAQVQAAGGPSTATLRNIENATQASYRSSNLRALERVLEWPDGTIDAILNGNERPTAAAPRRTPLLAEHEPELRQLATNPDISEHLKAWAQSILDQIEQLRQAEQRDAAERGRAAS
ncbi:hypothetical protein GCM10011608_09110 [Micromonospora sonchi]|uniref:HTH cro/C1-type domain-containing protein n=1 Tax=Micromonospora sonchi TaxID=1763543 RepID=A0A917TLK4_9ACTN|nr:helix-turn-helix domain-containing protein [Micromonospora sonchi]GGM26534.1 hypothetical protein GCM10011608_09110 [Micromonospora sonchi]